MGESAIVVVGYGANDGARHRGFVVDVSDRFVTLRMEQGNEWWRFRLEDGYRAGTTKRETSGFRLCGKALEQLRAQAQVRP